MTALELLTKVERFCRRTGMAPTRFGRNAVGASNLVERLRADRNITVGTVAKVLAYMREYRG